MSDDSLTDVLTFPEAAVLAGVTVHTVHHWRKQGRLTPVRRSHGTYLTTRTAVRDAVLIAERGRRQNDPDPVLMAK